MIYSLIIYVDLRGTQSVPKRGSVGSGLDCGAALIVYVDLPGTRSVPKRGSVGSSFDCGAVVGRWARRYRVSVLTGAHADQKRREVNTETSINFPSLGSI